jgi:toxin ParE1/3/4
MFSIKIYQTATDDLQDAYDYYEEQIRGLGERFAREVDEYLDLIRKNPFQFAVQFSGSYRFALLNHFPYRVVYRVSEKENLVYVISIFHTSRDPKKF